MGSTANYYDPDLNLGKMIPFLMAAAFSIVFFMFFSDPIFALLGSLAGMLGISAFVENTTTKISSIGALGGGFIGSLFDAYTSFTTNVIGGALNMDPFCIIFLCGYLLMVSVGAFNYLGTGHVVR